MRFVNQGKQMVVMPVRNDGDQPPAQEPKPETTNERTPPMVTNNAEPEPASAKPALETAVDQLEALKDTLKTCLGSVTAILVNLKTAQREQKVTGARMDRSRPPSRACNRCESRRGNAGPGHLKKGARASFRKRKNMADTRNTPLLKEIVSVLGLPEIALMKLEEFYRDDLLANTGNIRVVADYAQTLRLQITTEECGTVLDHLAQNAMTGIDHVESAINTLFPDRFIEP